jgi:excisionase family DNA binding protein
MSVADLGNGAQYLSVKEVSDRLRVSRGCIYELVEKGQLEHVRIGIGRGTIRIRAESVADYLARRRSGPETLRPKGGRKKLPFEHLDSERLVNAWRE